MAVTEDKGTVPNSTEASQPLFVPPSLFRVRQFLFEQGMQIVPWSSTEEVLNELHLLLQAHQSDESFWHSLRELLGGLNDDLQRLLPSSIRHNEMLELTTREAVLDELRRCVDPTPAPVNGFASLLRGMTQRCVALLLLIAGAAAVSCGARAGDDPVPTSGTGGVSAAGGSAATGGQSSAGGNANQGFTLPPGTGGSTVINPSGTVPCVTGAGGSSSTQLSMSDVQGIANQCIEAGVTRDDVLACLNTLNTSWQQGIAALLNCTNCSDAAATLLNMAAQCSQLTGQYRLCTLSPGACVPIYVGVRLD